MTAFIIEVTKRGKTKRCLFDSDTTYTKWGALQSFKNYSKVDYEDYDSIAVHAIDMQVVKRKGML